MRIGVIGPMDPDYFADNICSTLPRMGHEAIPLGSALPDVRGISRSVAVAEHWQRRIVRLARRSELDAILTVQAALLPSTVRSLRSLGVPIALWCPDSLPNLGRQLMFLAPYD